MNKGILVSFGLLTRWIAILTMFVVGLWSGFLAYLGHGFVSLHSIDDTKLLEQASLAAYLSVSYWPLLIVFSAGSFICGAYLIKTVQTSSVFNLSLSVLMLISIGLLNVMVVSTGYELMSMH